MNPTTPPTAPPPILITLVHDYAQKALTMAAVALAAHGATMTSSQQDQLIQFGVSAALFGLSCLWTYLAAKTRASRLATAFATVPPELLKQAQATVTIPVPANQGVAP